MILYAKIEEPFPRFGVPVPGPPEENMVMGLDRLAEMIDSFR